jgi:hypothetical protein
MALLHSFSPVTTSKHSRHGPVECGYQVFDVDGDRILQLDTYGSSSRQFQGKTSQSIQLDREAARRLLDLLTQAFPGI